MLVLFGCLKASFSKKLDLMGKCIECANNTLLKIMGRKALCFQGDQIGRLCPNGAFFIFAQFHEN
jgi:hypothetical protein